MLLDTHIYWPHFLIPACSCSGKDLKWGLGATVSLSASERLDILQEIQWNKLISGYFLDDLDHLDSFFHWVSCLWEVSTDL